MHEILEARVIMQYVELPLTAQPYQSLIVRGVGFFERRECLIALAQRNINRCQRHRREVFLSRLVSLDDLSTR